MQFNLFYLLAMANITKAQDDSPDDTWCDKPGQYICIKSDIWTCNGSHRYVLSAKCRSGCCKYASNGGAHCVC